MVLELRNNKGKKKLNASHGFIMAQHVASVKEWPVVRVTAAGSSEAESR